MEKSTHRIAIVTGANRGIGYETCRQMGKADIVAILTSRDENIEVFTFS